MKERLQNLENDPLRSWRMYDIDWRHYEMYDKFIEAAEQIITVTNTGTAPLTNVQVSDPLAPDCDSVIGALAAGESTTYTCSLAGMIGDITNQATVTGDDSSGTQISDSDTEPVDVISPELLVSKTPNDQTVIVNGTATFTITVTNTG